MSAFTLSVLSSIVAALLIFLGRTFLFVRHSRRGSDLVGNWIEVSSTIDDDNVTREHTDKVRLRRLRGSKFVVGSGNRLAPVEDAKFRWRYLGRFNETCAYMVFWRNDTSLPLRCGVVILRRQDDESWRGLFIKPTQRSESDSTDVIVIRSGLMTNPITWRRLLQ